MFNSDYARTEAPHISPLPKIEKYAPWAIPNQRDITKELLLHHILHITVANIIKCSMSQDKHMSNNLLKFGTLYKPKSKENSRSRVIISAAVQVHFYLNVFIVKKNTDIKEH